MQTEPHKPGAFLDTRLRLARPGRRERGKAAIEAGKRRAADAQFFQYELLDAGAVWRAWVDCDDPADLDPVAALLDGKVLRLGRSKRREYGGEVAVKVERGCELELLHAGCAGKVVLWCLSDLALPDPYGGVDLAPEPERFGIEGFTGRLDQSRSLIGTRRHAPYNLYLGARDREQAVIEAGSVLVYADAVLPATAFTRAVGLWRERGLGIIWANPAIFATGGQVCTLGEAPSVPPAPASAPTAEADAALLAMLTARARRASSESAITDAVATLLEQFLERHEATIDAGDPAPSANQWARVAEVAAIAAGRVALHNALFMPDDGICDGTTNAEWQTPGEHLRRLIEIPAERPEGLGDDDALRRAVQRLAHKMAAEIRLRYDR